MFAWLSLLALAPSAHAADVLVPEATPASLDDFAVAYMVYDMLATELRDRGVAVADAEDIAIWAGDDAEGCFDNDACPANLWSRTDARLAAVLSVGQGAGGLSVEARVYRRDRASPIEVVSELVREGGELAFSQKLAAQVAELLEAAAMPLDDDGGSGDDEPDVVVPVAAKDPAPAKDKDPAPAKDKGSTASTKDKDPAPTKAKDPAPAKDKGSTASTKDKDPAPAKDKDAAPALTDRQEAERRTMGIPRGAYQKFLASGAKKDDWLESARVRAGTAHVDAQVGLGAGDVSRGYGVWVHLVNDGGTAAIDGTSTWLGDGAGAGLVLRASVGYTPLWFLDLELGGGIQQGQKQLESGWECPDCNVETQLVATDYAPRMGIQLVVEPRAQFWLVPTGVAKPYLSVGAQLRVFDGFDVPGDEVPWPDEPGGVGFGVSGGVGLALDVSPRVSVLFDVPYTLHLSPATESTNSDLLASQPAPMNAWGGVLRVALGTSVRF